MNTFNFACLNDKCEGKILKVREISKVDNKTVIKYCDLKHFSFVLSDEDSKDEQLCQLCEKPLKKIGENTNFHAKIRSLSLKDKGDYFAKRSINHTKSDQDIKQRRKELNQANKPIKIID
jgi:hypothetical protein